MPRERRDAAVVLGCRVMAGGCPSTALARRIDLAARLYHAGVVPRVLASGGRRWHGHTEAEVIGRSLVAAGVPEDRVALELWSFTTVENGHYSAAWAERNGCREVVLATCAWHLPRALWIFRSFGLDASPPPPGFDRTPTPAPGVRFREGLRTVFDWSMLRRWR